MTSLFYPLLFALAANGQEPRGTITGIVTDSSQAPVPDVEVRATNPETGVTASAKSNSAGNYNIPFLFPGTYRGGTVARLQRLLTFLPDGAFESALAKAAPLSSMDSRPLP